MILYFKLFKTRLVMTVKNIFILNIWKSTQIKKNKYWKS